MFASPLIEFIAAAHATAIVGHACISASYAALRVAKSLSVASPRTAAIGMFVVPSGSCTSTVSCEVRSPCKRPHAEEPVVPSSEYKPSSASDIWCSLRACKRCNGPRCSRASMLTVASASASNDATQSARRASSGDTRASNVSSSLSRP